MDDFPHLATKQYNELRHEIKSGDILLCSGSSLFSNMIQKATCSVWSHVAFIIRLDMIERIMVLESVESIGVRAIPLSNYVHDYNATGTGYPGRLLLARHTELKQENIIKLSKFATDLLGYPYGTDEIVRIAARIGMGTLGFNAHQDNGRRREFICSEYAQVCFESIGIYIDYDKNAFISPADFARCPKVKTLSFIATNSNPFPPIIKQPHEKDVARAKRSVPATS